MFSTPKREGVAEIIGCERDSTSPWKYPGSWGWLLANARPLKCKPCKGALGFFRPFFIRLS